jgi:two-component system, response regulator
VDTNRYYILLIDDDLVQIEMARRAVVESCLDIELAAVAGGDAVLDWFRSCVRNNEQLPDIIMLDLKLPKLDNLAVLRKLRSDAPTCEMPIIVCSAEYTQDDILTSYKAGSNCFVAKPTDSAECAELFRERLAYWMNPQHKLLPSAKVGAAERI